MNDLIVGFIDSYDFLTILVDKSIKGASFDFYLIDENENKKKLELLAFYEEPKFYKFLVKYDYSIKLHKEYFIEDSHGNRGILKSGSIIRHPNFDLNYSYDGPLGAEYHEDKTIFRVWSPVAKEIYVVFQEPKQDKVKLHYVDRGLWECEVEGNCDGFSYLYSVRVFDRFELVADPYALSSLPNGKASVVIDRNKTYKMKYPKPEFSGIYTDAIIYEASVRDFTSTLEGDLKGTYLGMVLNNPTKNNEPTGLDYIASLGVTHLQLMPTYDFGGVDDLKKNSSYNWGYNPTGYLTPSGWLSKNPLDPYSRINELKELIDECHKRGLRVTMDVVFNHVYKSEVFAFDNLVPGYAFRIDYDGRLSNASGCGNVLASERYMNSRFIRDVLKYYMSEFNVDGYRYDLMGLLDIETLNASIKELREIEPKTIVYGEGWNMANPLPDDRRPHMYNHRKMPEYAFFNDRYRELVKGNQWSKAAGFAFGIPKSQFDITHIVAGSCLDFFKFDSPTQTINYVECHDNYTMYDYGKYALGLSEPDLMIRCRLALEMVIISEGIPFIHAGQEFLRTKYGVENSYNSKDSVNKIDYKRRDKYINIVNALRDLIKIRKEYPELRLANPLAIDRNMHVLEGLCDEYTVSLLVESKKADLIIIIKNNYEPLKFELDATFIYDAGSCNIKKPRYEINKPGVYILRKNK